MMVSVIMYKRLGISNADIALYTSWLYLPWVIKPIWSPIVDLLKTKRWWIVSMQLIIGAALASVALTFPLPNFFQISLVFLWLMAFSSATHDIAADGFYLLGLDTHNQSWFVGIRSSFYRLAMISGQGLLVVLAGYLEAVTGPEPVSITVNSVPNSSNSIVNNTTWEEPKSDEPMLIALDNELEAVTKVQTIAQRDSILQAVKNYNLLNGFYGVDAANDAKNERVEQLSSGQKNGALGNNNQKTYNALESWLKNTFGNEITEEVNNAGQVVVAKIRLHDPKYTLSGELIVNLGRDEGNASIKLSEGDRLVINDTNRDKEAWVAFELDPKLKSSVTTVFIGNSGNVRLAWSTTFGVLAVLFGLFFFYHLVFLPRPSEDIGRKSDAGFAADFISTFGAFFRRKKLGWVLAFLLLYRLGEAQLAKLAAPFLLDSTSVGGLGLTTGEVGFIYGTIGVAMLTIGGILGGILAAKDGLKKWLWWMVIAINLPNAVYVFLAMFQPDNFWVVTAGVAIEQFGYGFGFTAYMLYCIYISQGEHKTTHYAISTGFMALGMMLPGMVSGWLQELIGYSNFFVWVVIATVPAFIVTAYIPLDSEFGKKSKETNANTEQDQS
jgi:PAT family beta-lactamase induction signal transducer AmpG